MSRHVFHVVFFEDRGWWVAQCLERNMVAAAKDLKELPGKLQTVLRVQIEADREAGIEPFTALPQAPRRFWTMFQTAEPWSLDDSLAAPPPRAPAWAELAVA